MTRVFQANHLNLRKSSQIRDSTVSRDQPEKGDTEKEEEKGSEAMECRTRQPSGVSVQPVSYTHLTLPTMAVV